MSKRSFQDWIAAGCPRGPVAAVRKWRAANKRQPRREDLLGLSPRARLELRKIREDIRARRLKTDQFAGLLMLRHEAEEAINALCLRVKSRLEALPDEIEMLLPPEVRAVVKREIANKIFLTLKEMAQWTI